MKFNLTKDRRTWATSAWQTAVQAGDTTADTLNNYLESILQPFVDQKLNEITDSWKPEETVEIKERRAAAAELLKEIPVEKLAAVEAAISSEVEPKP